MVEHANDDELAEAAAHETETEEAAEMEVAEAEGMTEAADVDADDTEEVVEAEADDVDGDDAFEATGDDEPTVDPETWNKYLKIMEALLFASAEPFLQFARSFSVSRSTFASFDREVRWTALGATTLGRGLSASWTFHF